MMTHQELIFGLRRLCGYAESGTSTIVRLYQDDFTGGWILVVGKSTNWHHHETFIGVIEKAIIANTE